MASTSSFRASSSSSSSSSTPSIPRKSSYDVFLSFRGKDTRYNFTDHLYKALGRRGIRTFRDDKLRTGEAIAPELLKAIEESSSSVIVFSENYAGSRWCLDELVKIMERHKDRGHAVFPIFYHVDPTHVRRQTGSFGKAFVRYEEKWTDRIPRWRTALTEAANLSGWHLLDGYESNQIKEITDNIFRRLKCKRLDAGANLVGIDSCVKEMILRLHMESSYVRIVGIYGVGGIGKTTIAKVTYNKLSCEFECMSFLENIREVSNTQGLSHLQNQLLGDILEGEGCQNISSVAHKASMIKDILLSKRVFMVLDDVDDPSQLEYLLGHREWLGEGSRVIITTRNKHVLAVQEVDDLYEVKGLNFEEACELFSLYAFKQNLPKSDYRNLSRRVVGYCQGLPLALKVLGSLLFKKTIPQWESELNKLDKEPEMKIHNVLKRSYDGLDRTEKNIFLDVACFFKGEDRDSVSRILDGCDFHAERGIRNLNDLCLITLPYNQIRMHDLIQRMGWEIVREKFPDEPNKWSRLWDPHDIQRALTTYEGTEGVETINLDLSKLKTVQFNSNVFSKMTRLRLLKVHSNVDLDLDFFYDSEEEEEEEEDIMGFASNLHSEIPSYELRYLCWDSYPLDSLPSNFDGKNLVELHLKYSNIKQLWQGNKYLESLKVIDLSYSEKLVQMPEFSSLSNLERLILEGCVSLIDFHPSLGGLKKLTTLNLKGCLKIKGLPSSISNLESLEFLDLSKCSSFCKFSEIHGNMRCSRETATKDLPTSTGNSEKFPVIQRNMRSLRSLYLCKTAIKELPSSIDLESVEILDLSDCFEFEKFSENGAKMKSLWQLDLTNTAIKELPTGIANWESLPTLDLSKCSKFEKFPEIQGNMRSLKKLLLKNTAIKDLPDSIGDLESLEFLDISDCSKFEKFPEKGGNMKSLTELHLKNTAIKDLPDSIGDLESLWCLDLSDCSKFEKFPEKGGNMKGLVHLHLANTAIKDLPDSIGDLESLEFLYLSDCSKFEKFPEKGGNMKGLKKLHLKNTAIKDLPDSIGDLESLEFLDLSDCSMFEKFPEKGGNMKSLTELHLKNTAIKDLPDSIGDLESLWLLDLFDCSKFEKFPEKGGNMKSLTELHLKNTAIKDLPDSIGDLESLWLLDLSDCSKFEKFPEKGGNMKSLEKLSLKNTAIKDLPDSIGDLESLEFLDLSDCSKFEKFPEKGGNMKSLTELHLKNTAIKDLPDSIGDLESLWRLDLSDCSKFEKFPEKGGNMKGLVRLRLANTAIKDLPDSIGDLESLKLLDLSDCSKFEKFPEKGGNMKSLENLSLKNTAIKDLPDSIGDLESLELLDLSDCSKFEKFPEKGGNMKSLRDLCLRNTAIKDLPDSIGDLESLGLLDLSNCSKFEKFPEKGGNMKGLRNLCLRNTAIKDLPDSIGDLESLWFLDLSNCSKFEKFPEKGGNMKGLVHLHLKNTAIKDLPDSIGDLESLKILDLSDCSKFEKFPEKGGNMKSLMELDLKNTAIKDLPTNISRLKNLEELILGGCSDLWEGLISNQLCNLQKLNISQCKMAGQILVLPSSLRVIDAYHCTSKEDLSGLLWLCHLNWLKSTTEELKCWKLGAVIPESKGIPEWIRYQNMGSEVTTELPTNWYEDPNFLGFVVSCVRGPYPAIDYLPMYELNLHGNGVCFKDECRYLPRCTYPAIFKDLRDQVCVWWYPKIAIPKEHCHKYTHINASFWGDEIDIKKCGINLIYAGDQQNHMPMLEHPQNSGDNGSALQDTDGNVHGANQDDEHYLIPTLDLLGNVGDNGSVVLEDTKTVREDVMINSITSTN